MLLAATAMDSQRHHLPAHRSFRELRALALPADHYAVFGSGPLLAHGLTSAADLDVIARAGAWERAVRLAPPRPAASGTGSVVHFFGARIEVFDHWIPSGWDVDELIDTAEVIDGIRFVPLPAVLRWKLQMARPKDAHHVAALRRYLGRHLDSLP
jgi:hypothetical protein